MSKTTNYQLTVWDYGDEDFSPGQIREDLAENFTALDRVLKAEETARSSGLAEKVGIVAGSYAVDGKETRIISFGFTPKGVYLCTESGCAGYAGGSVACFGGLALPNLPAQMNSNERMVEIITGGFKIYHRSSYISTNSAYQKYHYIAFR